MAGAGALYLAEYFGWLTAYLGMAALVTVGVITVLLVSEPQREGAIFQVELSAKGLQRWVAHSVIGPFVEFFERNGRIALLILIFIAVFRLSDIAMGIMANPFYLDMGYSKTDIAKMVRAMKIAHICIAGALPITGTARTNRNA